MSFCQHCIVVLYHIVCAGVRILSLTLLCVVCCRWERERALGLRKRESDEDNSYEGLSDFVSSSSKLFCW